MNLMLFFQNQNLQIRLEIFLKLYVNIRIKLKIYMQIFPTKKGKNHSVAQLCLISKFQFDQTILLFRINFFLKFLVLFIFIIIQLYAFLNQIFLFFHFGCFLS